MTEIQKLAVLRDKLVARRRALVESLQKMAVEQLTGDSIAGIQRAIDAVDKAMIDEKNVESNADDPRRRASS